jgi:hypothetical protein
MIDIMQVSESLDDVLRKNFVSQTPCKSVGLEVNASSYKVRKPVQRKRGKHGGKKVAEKSEGKAPAAQGVQGGKGKKEAKPPRNDKPYGQQDQTCYKCGIRGQWSCICEDLQHVIDAYQASRKAKASAEAHMVEAVIAVTPSTTTPHDLTPLQLQQAKQMKRPSHRSKSLQSSILWLIPFEYLMLLFYFLN